MTSGTAVLDKFIKEYLIFRGFVHSAKQLDSELRSDRDKGFRADLVVDTIITYITSYDLHNLKEFWRYLEERVFSRLEAQYYNSTKKLYFSILKYYVVHATSNHKPEKVTEFFVKMTTELQPHQEWKDWFALPYIKNPETNEIFSVCFTKQWQDALQLSLYNYISIVFQSMPTPSLMDIQRPSSNPSKSNDVARRRVKHTVLRGSMDMVDDFYTLTQNITLEDPNTTKPKNKSIVAKGIAKVKGSASATVGRAKAKAAFVLPSSSLPNAISVTSPIANDIPPTKPVSPISRPKRPTSIDHNEMRQELLGVSSQNNKISQSAVLSTLASASVPNNSTKLSPTGGAAYKEQEMQPVVNSWQDPACSAPDFLLSGQHTYNEHGNSITHAKFSRSGHCIASADIDGVIKIWTRDAVPVTTATVISKHQVLSVEFVDKTDKLLLIGGKPGHVKVFDIPNKKSVEDILVTGESSSTKISDISVDEGGSNFACSTLVSGGASGIITTWDLTTGLNLLRLSSDAIQSLTYCSNSNSLIMGGADGTIKILDLRQGEIVKTWKGHSGKVYTMQISQDNQSCYTMDSDNTVSQWNVSSGKLIQSFSLHDGAAGPFVFSEHRNHKQIRTPKDKIFSLNYRNSHLVTCHKNSALVYKIIDGEAKKDLFLGGHQAPVVAVDWVAGDTETCLTADMSGSVKLSTILS